MNCGISCCCERRRAFLNIVKLSRGSSLTHSVTLLLSQSLSNKTLALPSLTASHRAYHATSSQQRPYSSITRPRVKE